MAKKKNIKKEQKKSFKTLRQRFRLILTRRKNKLYIKTSEKGNAKQIKPTNKRDKKNVRNTVKEMEKAGIRKIDMKSEVKVDVKKVNKKKLNKDTSAIKKKMGKNTDSFIKGKKSKEAYKKTDEKLHKDLDKKLKK